MSEALHTVRRKADSSYLSPEKNVPLEVSPMKVGCLQLMGGVEV